MFSDLWKRAKFRTRWRMRWMKSLDCEGQFTGVGATGVGSQILLVYFLWILGWCWKSNNLFRKLEGAALKLLEGRRLPRAWWQCSGSWKVPLTQPNAGRQAAKPWRIAAEHGTLTAVSCVRRIWIFIENTRYCPFSDLSLLWSQNAMTFTLWGCTL